MSGFMFRNSSAPAPDFLGMSTKLGAAYSLHKPFRPRELMKAIESCLGGADRSVRDGAPQAVGSGQKACLTDY
jgi:hypothetical protein